MRLSKAIGVLGALITLPALVSGFVQLARSSGNNSTLAKQRNVPWLPVETLPSSKVQGPSVWAIWPSGALCGGAICDDVHIDPPRMIIVPNRASKRTAQDLKDICKSPDFQYSPENYILSGAGDWLERYTLLNKDSNYYKQKGLLGKIAYDYLGDDGFKCGVGSSSLCKVKCSDIVSTINNLTEARTILYNLKSAQHFNLAVETVHSALEVAQNNIGLWAPTMARTFYWATPSSYEKTVKMILGYLNLFIQVLIGSAANFIQTSAILELAEASLAVAQTQRSFVANRIANPTINDDISNLRKHLSYLDSITAARKDTLNAIATKVSTRRGYGGEQWYGIASGWFESVAPQLMFDAVTNYADLEGETAAPEQNAADLMKYIQQTTATSRVQLHQIVDHIFSGKGVEENGITSFSKLVGSGSYLPVNDKALAKWTAPEVEENISRKILLKALDGAFKSQRIWISCTKDFRTTEPRKNTYSRADTRTTSCGRDRSGPQDLKECVDDHVCYLYKWDARGPAGRHQVERPYGMDDMGEPPYNINVKDIIYSSVKTHLMNRADEPLKPSTNISALESAELAESLWDPRAPGAFSIPVCMSTHNWMAPVEPVFDLTCDTNAHCRKKNLPCNCGLWGNETEAVWKESGLWYHKDAKEEYKKHLCPRQIEKKIQDPLEKFVAYCRLGVRRSGGIKKTGAHPLCGSVIETIGKLGDETGVIDEDTRVRLGCTAGIIKAKHCKFIQAIGLP